MKVWTREVTALTQCEIMSAIDDDSWQTFRKSLKGLPTTEKLWQLNNYLEVAEGANGRIPRVEQVRVDNYINALLRGGQLMHEDGQIVVQR